MERRASSANGQERLLELNYPSLTGTKKLSRKLYNTADNTTNTYY